MEEKIAAKALDGWIARLEECKQLEEKQVRILCEKVRRKLIRRVVPRGNDDLMWCENIGAKQGCGYP